MFNEKPSKEEQMAATQVSGCECGGGLIYSVTSGGDNYNQIMLYTLPTTTYIHVFSKVQPLPIMQLLYIIM